MAGPRLITTKYFLVGLNLLFLLLLIPLTRGVLYLAPPPTDNNPPPQFILTFDVEEYDDRRWEAAYERLIGSLRTRLGSGSRWERLGVPVLHRQAPEGQVPTLWFHLVLQRLDGTNITLRVRGDNLYVVGFRRGGGTDDQWWECRRKDKKDGLIKGSKPLGFSCNYNHLEGVAGQATSEVGLGRHRLRDAAAQLASVHHPDEEPQPTARSLMAVIIMVSEATRFREISDLIMTRGEDVDTRQFLTPRMDVLIRGWGDISERVFRADQNPERSRDTFPFTLRRGQAVVVLFTAHAAELLLGILLLPQNCPWRPAPRILLLAPVQEGGGSTDAAGHCAEGRPLLEVFSVIINDISGEDPGQLYGTIKVTDALGAQIIYDRHKDKYENVSPRKAATLTGPADRAISALATITIDLHLWDSDLTAFNPDGQVSKGTIEWDHLAFAKRYNTRLSQTVKGTHGSATVNYVVFSDAVEAKFEVTLVRGYERQRDGVYGRIVARIGDLGIESVLLSTTDSDYSYVSHGDRIPLQRTIVAVPLSSYIRVSALLYDYGDANEIAGGCTYFGAKSSGITRWRITGQFGEIEVKVTWSPSY